MKRGGAFDLQQFTGLLNQTKDPKSATNPLILEALECVAETQLLLEGLGDTPQPGAIKGFHRLIGHAASSPDPICLPNGLFRLACAYANKNEIEKSLSFCWSAFNSLDNVSGETAKELRKQVGDTIAKLAELIAEEDEGTSFSTGD